MIVLKLLLLVIVLFRVFVAVTMEPAFLFNWPLDLAGCPNECRGKQYSDLCVKVCDIRKSINLDLKDYIKMDTVLASSFGKTSFNVLMVELITFVTPVLLIVSLGLFTRAAFFRKLGLFIGGIIFQMMFIYAVEVYLTVPLDNALKIYAYNIGDLLTPILLLILGFSDPSAPANAPQKKKKN